MPAIPSPFARAAVLCVLLSLTLLPGLASPETAGPGPEALLGFTPAGSEEQRALEERFDALLDADNLAAWMERLAGHPHPVGSPGSQANAEFMAELFRSWGYETRIEEFEVLFPTPEVRRVEMLEPEPYLPSLEEPAIPEDSTSGQDGILPPYNAYSVDGDVTGELVYVNYGRPQDYEELDRRGISVEGRIAIARYGGAWRGIKPKLAAEHGAVGCLIYSDPRDDGYFRGDTYPEGGYRPAQGAQRGSVADMPLYPGDPLTPGVGATADAERLAREEAPTLTKIPVLPLSWADAKPLLKAMEGPVAPPAWRGALPLTYHLGPGPATVRLTLEFDWRMVTAYDVIAVLPGAELPDQWIVRGNHHDAWVHGATDPISGMVALLEEARAVGELARAGHRPRRTLVYAGWDAEEPGLLGSVEWAETHADELREKAVAYLNTDSVGRGFFWAGGSHTLERLVHQAASDVDDPRLGTPLPERVEAAARVRGGAADRLRSPDGAAQLRLAPLGSGSDYTPFLQHLGIASLNLGFGGEDAYGQYHSAYDSVDHFRRFMDPDYLYGATMAKVTGRVMLRLANAELLPFEFTALAEEVGRYVDELEELADTMRRETAERNRLLAEGAYTAAADPEATYVPPEPREPVPHLGFAPLRNGHARLEAAARRYDEALSRVGSPAAEAGEGPDGEGREEGTGGGSWAGFDPATLAEVDSLLYRTERALTRPEGLPGREWFVHHLYAPGFYTGYGVKTVPGAREAIEQREWTEADHHLAIAGELLTGLAAQIDRAAEILEGGGSE